MGKGTARGGAKGLPTFGIHSSPDDTEVRESAPLLEMDTFEDDRIIGERDIILAEEEVTPRKGPGAVGGQAGREDRDEVADNSEDQTAKSVLKPRRQRKHEGAKETIMTQLGGGAHQLTLTGGGTICVRTDIPPWKQGGWELTPITKWSAERMSLIQKANTELQELLHMNSKLMRTEEEEEDQVKLSKIIT